MSFLFRPWKMLHKLKMVGSKNILAAHKILANVHRKQLVVVVVVVVVVSSALNKLYRDKVDWSIR